MERAGRSDRRRSSCGARNTGRRCDVRRAGQHPADDQRQDQAQRMPGAVRSRRAPRDTSSPDRGARMTRGYALAVFAVIGPALAFIAAVALWLNGIGPSRTDLIVFAVGTVATTAGVELGFHRYFAPRGVGGAAGLV